MVRLMRTEKKKLAGEISEIRPERLEDSRHMNLDVPDRDQHRCNRTVYVSFRSEDSRCGATPLLLLRDWVRVNRYIDYTAVSKNRASLVAENSYVELDNQISEIARSMRTKKKSWKCDKCV